MSLHPRQKPTFTLTPLLGPAASLFFAISLPSFIVIGMYLNPTHKN